MTKLILKGISSLSIRVLFVILVSNASAQKQVITEPINFSKLVFNSDEDFSDQQFLSSLSFNESVFKSSVLFFNSNFSASTYFNKARFEKEVLFNDATFRTFVNFSHTNFEGEVEFTNAEFSTENKSALANFSDATFNKAANFENTTFNGDADFRYLSFRNTSFEKALFHRNVDFSDATFDSLIIFNEAVFNEEANYQYAKFKSGVSFQKAKFNGDVDFGSTLFSKQIDFSFVTKISNEIDLTMSIIPGDKPCNINLVGAAINKIRFRYKRFKLWFPEFDSTNLNDLKLDYDLKASVYEALLQKQQSEGFTESYEILDKEYREFKYTYSASGNNKVSWGHIKNWVDKHWWGYGYNKELIVLNSIILYLLFSFLNVFFIKHLTRNVYNAEKINEYWDENQGSGIKTFINSIPFSLFYTAQIFFGFKFDVDKLKYKENLQGWKIFNLLYFITIFLSGLVCLAYLMNYVLTV